ncbi:MAG: PD-(D/E)XK nuclease family protein [Bacteroidaceae bacterium]|nr:PD-(D/E)XK nuclease family protein [Bacteroidaceae bacterium]
MVSANNDNLILLANEFGRFIEEAKEKNPYQINLVETIGVDENAHSRILMNLLKYNKRGTYPILESFVENIINKETTIFCSSITNPRITYQEHDIDVFIRQCNDYGIIIENKVHGAVDQNKQIEKYVKYAKKECCIDDRNIIVIYLTNDGKKEVKDFSLTPHAQQMLGIGTKSNRFLEINYEEHILPWLKNEVNEKIIFDKETHLKSAILQYIDYLETWFQIREEDKQLDIKKKAFVIEKMNTKDIRELFSTYDSIFELQECVGDLLLERVEAIGRKISSKLERKGYTIKSSFFDRANFRIEIVPNGWKKAYWVFEYDNGDKAPYSGVLYEKELSQKAYNALYNYYGHSNSSFAGWKYENKYIMNDEFWFNLDENINPLVRDIENMIKDVHKEMEGIFL